MKRFYPVFIILIFVFLLGGVPCICAQEADVDEFTLEEITVTAQKRTENQQKVPIQMEVISGEKLSELGQDNVDEILRNVSNAIINMSPDGMRVTVRGLAEENSPWHDMRVSTPTVGVNVDGSYNTYHGAGENLFDIERVEVLAGPQSTLYGSNSPGGIVNVVTAAPKTDRYSASGSIEYAKYSVRNYQAVLNAPVYSDKIAMRLAAQRSEQGTWVDNGDNTSERTTARLRTLFQPSDRFSATITLNWGKSSSGGRRRGNVRVFDYQDGSYEDGTPVTNPWTAEEGGGAPPPPPASVGNFVISQGPPPGPPPGGGGPGAVGNDAITKAISADISWDTGIGALTIVPSVNNSQSENFDDEVEVQEDVFSTQYSENHTEQKNLEVRMASPQDFPFTWIVGGTYYDSDRLNWRDDYIYDDNDSLQNTTQENKGLYANITYPLTDRFRATAGYRQSWDSAGNVEDPPKVGNGITGQDYSNPDYKVGFEYDLAGNTMLYGSYATSYRVNAMAVGQASGQGGLSRDIPPEELKAYSVGAKNRFLDNKLQVNASAFYYDYSNKTFRATDQGRIGRGDFPVPDEGEAAYPYTDANGVYHEGTDLNFNGTEDDTYDDLYGTDISDPWIQQFGGFRSFGLDVSTDWIVTSKDRLNLSVSYLDAEWSDGVIEFYWYWIWPDHGKDYVSGRPNTFSPEWSITGSYEHSFTLWEYGMLVPHIDIQYKTEYYLNFDPADYPYNYQEPYYLINGNITYTHSSGKWSLNAYIKNAENYAVKTFWMSPAGGATLGLNDPRTYGAVFSLRF